MYNVEIIGLYYNVHISGVKKVLLNDESIKLMVNNDFVLDTLKEYDLSKVIKIIVTIA